MSGSSSPGLPPVIKVGTYLNPDAIAALFLEVGWHDEANVGSERLDRAFNRSGVAISAWRGDDLCGFVRASYDGMYWFLWNLVVAQREQGKGLGTALYTRLLAATGELGDGWLVGLRDVNRSAYYDELGLTRIPYLVPCSNHPRL